ncbi:hypothetical protein HYC85_028506 [Camellia sinensis]|uniref:Uncharacterized protein n=1 Tax=Camellia sinensis TaxID=4442 RepID=A0A7J7FVG0_CAMSI|nr:hypothetical protein HYC85_028506 [Camellia sinensis]
MLGAKLIRRRIVAYKCYHCDHSWFNGLWSIEPYVQYLIEGLTLSRIEVSPMQNLSAATFIFQVPTKPFYNQPKASGPTNYGLLAIGS